MAAMWYLFLERGLHTHQRIARDVHSCWSGDSCGGTRRPTHGLRWLRRGVQTDAIESIAGRRKFQIGKKTLDIQMCANRQIEINGHKFRRRIACRARHGVRVTRAERLVIVRKDGRTGTDEILRLSVARNQEENVTQILEVAVEKGKEQAQHKIEAERKGNHEGHARKFVESAEGDDT